MILNLNDPRSIVAWWRVYPERHDAYLDEWLQAGSEWAAAILEARRHIAADPALRNQRLTVRQARRAARHTEQIDPPWPPQGNAYAEAAAMC